MIYSIGHSNHTIETFTSLLRAHAIDRVADVRTIPHSRRHPQFNHYELEQALHQQRITYRHFPALGGLRTPLENSVNTAWQHEGFRGYADYMQGAGFQEGLRALLAFSGAAVTTAGNPQAGPDSGTHHTAVMCAEAAWWECHRQLLSDALLVANVPVQHILVTGETRPHELSPFSKTEDGKVIYPGLL